MFHKVLIANRGEIACRVIRTLKKMGMTSVAVYARPTRIRPRVAGGRSGLHRSRAGGESYLNGDRIIEPRKTGAQAIHPGYGFLSENPEFAQTRAEPASLSSGRRRSDARRSA